MKMTETSGQERPEHTKKNQGKSTAKPKRRLGRRVIYVLFLVAVVELALQLFYFATAGDWLYTRIALPIFTVDEDRGWAVKPELEYRHKTREFSVDYITNKEGFRTDRPDRFYVRPKPAGVFRILLIGPSFAFGWANDYADSYGVQVKEALGRSGAFGEKNIEVINAGIPSLHGLKQKNWCENEGCSYEPDLVILMHYGGMVMYNHPGSRDYLVSEDGYLITPGADRWVRLRKRAKRSAIVFYGYMLSKRIGELRSQQPAGQKQSDDGSIKPKIIFDPENERVRETVRLLAQLQDRIESKKGKLMIVYVPESYTVHLEDRKRWKDMGYRDAQQVVDLNDETCRHYAQSLEIPCVNLTGSLRNEADNSGERMYYHLDVHWTPRGNRVAAEATARTIISCLNPSATTNSPEGKN